MTTAIKRRRGTTSEHSTFTGLEGELTIDTTKDTVVVHDGATAGGFPLVKETNPILNGNVTTTGLNFDSNTFVINTVSKRIGINTASPLSGIDVIGSTNSAGVAKYNILSRSTEAFDASPQTGLAFAHIFNSSGTYSISAGINSAKENSTSGERASNLTFHTSDNSTSMVEQMRITSAGNVGVGTASPTSKLTVNGSFNVTGGTTLGDASGDALTINSSAVSIPNGLNFDSNTLVIDATNNRVGVGVASPAYALQVTTASSGAVSRMNYTGGSRGARIEFGLGETAGGVENYIDFSGSSGTSAGIFKTSGTEVMRLTSAGNVGIGTSSPSTRLHVSGSGVAATFNRTDNVAVISLQYNGTQGGYLGTAGTGNITFYDNTGAEKMRLDASGNLGIGTSSPTVKLDVNGIVRGSGTSSAFTESSEAGRFGSTSSAKWLMLGYNTTADAAFIQGVHSSVAWKDIVLQPNGGNLGLGVTPSAWGSSWRAIELNGFGLMSNASNPGLYLMNNAFYNGTNYIYKSTSAASNYTQTSGAHAWFNAVSGTAGNAITFTQAMTLNASGNLSVGTTVGNSKFTVQGNATVQLFDSTGGNQADLDFPSADVFRIRTYYGSGSTLTFATNPNGGGNTERMRIDSSGRVGIGITSPSSYYSNNLVVGASDQGGITIANSSTTGENLLAFADGASGADRYTGFIGYIHTNNAMRFATNGGTERMRINSSGVLLVGVTSEPTSGGVNGVSISPTGSYFSRNDTVLQTQIRFANGNGVVGTITTTGSGTAYNTSSDYRLKDNQAPLTGSGVFIDALQPKTWTWTADGSTGVGFIAHEVQAVSPNSVVGEKDAVDEEGKPVMQAMEYGSAEFIANIIAELQDLRKRVAVLESK
jgi:hypothetical protein